MLRKKLVLFAVLCIVVGTFAFGCATGKKAYVAGEDEEIYGVWSNSDYKGAMFWDNPKIEFQTIPTVPSGKHVRYKTETSQTGSYEATYQVHRKWIDEKGNVWYKMTMEYMITDSKMYCLARISAQGKTLEICIDDHDYPPEIDPNTKLYDYYIYHQE
jgi:hypothetical protein